MRRSGFTEGVAAGVAGLLLYGAAAWSETLFATGPKASAILEEIGKMILLFGFGWAGTRVRGEGSSGRQAQAKLLGLARGLSLGLVAITIFATAENLAYLLAFEEAGVLARLLWSLPVHLVAALAEALGILSLFRGVKGNRILAGGSLWFASLCLACAWHLGANLLVSDHFASTTFTTGVVIANLLFLMLLLQFLKQAYLGGFLHGAD